MCEGGEVAELASWQAPDPAVRQIQLVQAGQLGQTPRLYGQTASVAADLSAGFGVLKILKVKKSMKIFFSV